MTEILRPTETQLRWRMADAESRFPNLAAFDEGCECCRIDRFAEAYGWSNVAAYRQWSDARWLLGEGPK